MSYRALFGAAHRELGGVGESAAGEWEAESTIPGAKLVHLRRRLTADEAMAVGPVVDVRGTPDATRRVLAVAKATGIPVQRIRPL